MLTVPLQQEYNNKMHPKMFAMLLGMGSIVMMFAGLTSAYLVRKAQGDWVDFIIPEVFTLSTAIIVLSSVTLQFAYVMQKKENSTIYRLLLAVSLVLGTAFLFLQLNGWQQLTDIGIRLTGNPSGSFLYVISGMHALHIIGGLLFMLIFFIKSFFKKDAVKNLIETINPNRFLGMKILLVYWHFVGALWLYLFIFFTVQSA